MAPSPQIRSSSLKRSFLVARSSTIDSITRSQSASSPRSVTARTRPSTASRSASSSFPRSTCLASDFSSPATIGRRALSERLRSITSKPALAATSAMPEPMIPEPTIPTRLMLHDVPLVRRRGRDTARSVRSQASSYARRGSVGRAFLQGAAPVSRRRSDRPLMAKHATGTLALVGGGEWTRRRAASSTPTCSSAAGTDEVVVLPTAAAFEHPDRAVERARAYFDDLGAKVQPLTVLHRADAEDADGRRGVAKAALRLPRRRLAAAPALGAQGVAAVRGDRHRLPTTARCWRRRARARPWCATRWSIPAAAPTPSGSAWSWVSRCSRTTAPPPTTCASARSTSCPTAPTLVGIDEETALVRDPGRRRGGREGAGEVSLYEDGKAAVVRRRPDGRPADGLSGRRRYDLAAPARRRAVAATVVVVGSVAVRLRDRDLEQVARGRRGRPSPLGRREPRICCATSSFLATFRPLPHRAHVEVVGRARGRPLVTMKNCDPVVPGSPVRHRHRSRPGTRRPRHRAGNSSTHL